MTRLLSALVATACLATTVWADATTTSASADETAPVEDTRDALKKRGLVFQVGKRFLVVLPLAQQDKGIPATVTLRGSMVYVGSSSKLTRSSTGGWDFTGKNDFERVGIDDPWQLLNAELVRTGESYEVTCSPREGMTDRRRLTLTRADEKTASTLLAKATLFDEPVRQVPVFLGRINTTYVYVDTSNFKDYRLFMGKRGALKTLAIKEIVDDAEGMILVTVKGTLIMKRSRADVTSSTFGTAKKPATVEVLSTVKNRRLIYRDLGVYKSTPPGHPCYEL